MKKINKKKADKIMGTLSLYYDLLSQPARALYMFIKLNNIPFEPNPIEIMKGMFLVLTYQNLLKKKIL